MALDRGTRIYALFLLALVVGLVALALYQPPLVRDLNRKLAADPQLADFPYHFRVLAVEDHTAVMSTPRSPAMPVARILPLLFPDVAGQDPQSPAFQAAQKRLARAQAHARKLVQSAPHITTVRWQLDRDWLIQHGLEPPAPGMP